MPRSQFAIRDERSDICANEYGSPVPVAPSTIQSAGRSLPRAIGSK